VSGSAVAEGAPGAAVSGPVTLFWLATVFGSVTASSGCRAWRGRVRDGVRPAGFEGPGEAEDDLLALVLAELRLGRHLRGGQPESGDGGGDPVRVTLHPGQPPWLGEAVLEVVDGGRQHVVRVRRVQDLGAAVDVQDREVPGRDVGCLPVPDGEM
jgi:hypothetical protein